MLHAWLADVADRDEIGLAGIEIKASPAPLYTAPRTCIAPVVHDAFVTYRYDAGEAGAAADPDRTRRVGRQ